MLYAKEVFGCTQNNILNVSISRREISQLAGTSEEQSVRSLTELEKEKIIAKVVRKIKILSNEKLQKFYDEVKMDIGFRADIIIENKVIVEIKSIEAIAPVHNKTLLTYLKLTNLKLGLLVNFNVNLIKDGITRIVNNL